MLATGQTALKGVGGLQALNKPLSQQVEDVLRAPERALQKVRRQRQEHDSVLCEGQSDGGSRAARGARGDATAGDSADEHVGKPGGDAVQPAGQLPGVGGWKLRRATVAGEASDVARDVESYDDSAFLSLIHI